MTEPPRQQLTMLWPEERLATPPVPQLPPGYTLRFFDPDRDMSAYLALMRGAGFAFFDEAFVRNMMPLVLPDGFLLAVHQPSGALAASALAVDKPAPWGAAAGELGWVGGSAEHRNKGLGLAVCAAAVARLIRAGYRCIYLLTEDFRLPALVTYLRLGFLPYLNAPDMHARWQAICQQIGWPFTPERWPSTEQGMGCAR